jgi:hypothetical protein
MIVILDTRNQKDAFVEDALKKLNCTIIRSKLPFGDVALSTDILNCVDLKSSSGGLLELSKNVCSNDHSRVKREIRNCLEVDGKITFLCFEPGIKSVDEIDKWQVPKFKGNMYAKIKTPTGYVSKCLHRKGELMTKVKPETLKKAIKTMSEQDHYKKGFAVNFEFTTKEECGRKILAILQKEEADGNKLEIVL